MTADTAIAFSVIVPTRDRPAALGRCLESLANLDYPRDLFEVLVVDDGGTLSPQASVDAIRERVRVRVIARAHAGPAAARNAGAAEAAHPVLAFIDDDCRADRAWLTALARALAEDPGRMVGGRIVNALTRNPFADASQTLIAYLYDYFNRDGPRFFCSNNLAADRATFLAVGGFDASFPFAAGEDRDLCDRWHFARHAMCYAPDALVYHSHDLDLRGFWRQHLRYGRAAAHYHELFASRRGREVAVEPPHFYVNLVRWPFNAGMPPARALACAGLLVVSQIANAGGFVYERYRRGRERSGVSA